MGKLTYCKSVGPYHQLSAYHNYENTLVNEIAASTFVGQKSCVLFLTRQLLVLSLLTSLFKVSKILSITNLKVYQTYIKT